MRRVVFASAIAALALVVVGAPVVMAQGLSSAGLKSGGGSGVLPSVSIPTNATICLDYPTCSKTIGYDGTNTNVIGNFLGTGSVRANNGYLIRL